MMLLAVYAGETPYEGIRRYGADLLWHAGWARGGGPVSEGAAIEYARPTWDTLRMAGTHELGLAHSLESLRRFTSGPFGSGRPARLAGPIRGSVVALTPDGGHGVRVSGSQCGGCGWVEQGHGSF